MNFAIKPGKDSAKRGEDAFALEPIRLEWLAPGGMLAFGAWLLGLRGVWALVADCQRAGLTIGHPRGGTPDAPPLPHPRSRGRPPPAPTRWLPAEGLSCHWR